MRDTIAKMETFLGDYATFKEPGIRLPLTLWCICTHVIDLFDAFPYMVITSSTKRSGKTRASELIGFLACNPKAFSAMTPATLFQVINPPNQVHLFEGEEKRKKPTVVFDEAEVLSSESASTMRAVLNVGYRRGQTIPRMVGRTVQEFDTYCPKVFVLIGDVYDTLRDRSMIVEMQRADTPKRFSFEEVRAQAEDLKMVALSYLKLETETLKRNWHQVETRWLADRDAEIWRPLFAACQTFCPERMLELQRCAADLCASKTAQKKRYVNMDIFETEAENDEYAKRLLADVKHLFGFAYAGTVGIPPTSAVASSNLLQMLHDLPLGPWRKFRGDGLNMHTMADLLSRFGLHPKPARINGGKTQRCYLVKDVVKVSGKV